MRFSRAGSGSLVSRATHAFGWSFINNAVGRLSMLGIGIVLARLLGPHAFGTYAVALVGLTILLAFNELGVSLAIVRWPGEPREIAPTVATISIATSVLIYAGCFFGAPAFASALGAPQAANVVRVLALNVIIDGVVSVPVALMQRHFRMDRKAIADQVDGWTGAAVSITLAVLGFGAMSLAIGRITGALASAVLFIALSPEPLRLGFNREHARALLRFGLPLAGSSIIVIAIVDADQLVVGHFLGATLLGYYALATNLSNWPLNIFSMPVRSVAPALFSRVQHDRRAMRAGFVSGAGLLIAITFPICLTLAGASRPIIGFVYGARWALAAHALIWLGLLAALRILFEFVYDYFVVLARSRVVFTVQLVWLVVLVPALIAGAKLRGISGTGMAEVAVAALLVLPWYLYELNRVGIPLLSLLGSVWFPLASALGVGLFALSVSRLIDRNLIALSLIGPVALITVGMLLLHLKPQLIALRPVLERSADGVQAGGDVARDEPVAVPSAHADAGRVPAALGTAMAPALAGEFRDGTPTPASAAAKLRPLSLQDTMPLPIYREAAGPIVTFRDPAGRYSLPRRPDQPGPAVQRRKSEPYEADTLIMRAVTPAGPVNGIDKRRDDARRHDD